MLAQLARFSVAAPRRVLAAVAGEWVLDDGARLSMHQNFQILGGTLSRLGQVETLTNVVLSGSRIRFSAGGRSFEGVVNGGTINGVGWNARRVTAHRHSGTL